MKPRRSILWRIEAFCAGNALKYLMRAGRKTDNPVEDLKKARWYIDRLIKLYEAKR